MLSTSATGFRLVRETIQMTQGTPVRFKAVITLSDGYEVDVTDETTWMATCAEYRISNTSPTRGTVQSGFVGTWAVVARHGAGTLVGYVVISPAP